MLCIFPPRQSDYRDTALQVVPNCFDEKCIDAWGDGPVTRPAATCLFRQLVACLRRRFMWFILCTALDMSPGALGHAERAS